MFLQRSKRLGLIRIMLYLSSAWCLTANNMCTKRMLVCLKQWWT